MSKQPPRAEQTEVAPGAPQKTSLLQAAAIIVAAVGLFFLLLEGGLALLGVKPVLRESDPFVGFAASVPLFEPMAGPDGQPVYATAPGKYTYFNPQLFPRDKGADTYRIFCLGGSTTYGRPYTDLTSFAGWLRELLPEADPGRRWEVINAGGISYASYRVARLMEELVAYQPDLFIIYTGHNEFLEARTYGALQEAPEALTTTVGVLARTRTWAAMTAALKRLGVVPQQAQPQQVQLAAEVNTILDQSAGLQSYHRDDPLRDGILEHYRVSLERMADLARQAGAQVIFVTPESNLRDCSPFKSEHTPGLDPGGVRESEALLASAHARLQATDWAGALSALDRALAIDPRLAELHFRRGQALFELKRFDEALAAFERAREEDVCPLRALAPMRGIVAAVARGRNLPLVDYVDLVGRSLQAGQGHRIPGEESFLDHVHPTIAGHRLLATALVEAMIADGIVRPAPAWPETAVANATARVESRIDPYLQAKALLNLTKVQSWARKVDEARRSARQALVLAKDYPQLAAEVSTILLAMGRGEGEAEPAPEDTVAVLQGDPWNPQGHYQLGLQLFSQGREQEGAAHLLFAAGFRSSSAEAQAMLGKYLYRSGRYEIAYPYLKQAAAAAPDREAQQAIADMRKRLGPVVDELALLPVVVRYDPAKRPRQIFMARSTAPGSELPDGILTEWSEDGALKRYAEYYKGVLHGVELQWDEGGALRSRALYKRGVRAGN